MGCKTVKFKLISGNEMPSIGFGTFQIRGFNLMRDCLDHALAAGYRLIDTAAVYGNEIDVGRALKELLPKHNLNRNDIFITSKLSPSDQGDAAFGAVKTSVRNLDCDYLDLYLIHWPGASGIVSVNEENAKLRQLSWAGLVKAREQGLVKDIGVSNYTTRHLKALLSHCCGIKPAVNQIEWHPHYRDFEMKNFCEKEGIVIQAYSSLGGTNNQSLLSDAKVSEMSQKLHKSKAQILLRWAIQQNVAIIPKARSKQRIGENIELDFVIPENDMNILNNEMSKNEKYAWDPDNIA